MKRIFSSFRWEIVASIAATFFVGAILNHTVLLNREVARNIESQNRASESRDAEIHRQQLKNSKNIEETNRLVKELIGVLTPRIESSLPSSSINPDACPGMTAFRHSDGAEVMTPPNLENTF